MNPFKPKTTDDSSPEDKSVIGRNSFWSAPKFSLRRYILIAGGLLVLAGGIVLLAASPSTVSPTNCFSSPGSCGYPDPAYHNVGATSTCSSLTSEPNGYTASTAGETVQNMNITGSLTIAAPNVTVNNVCVTASGNSGNMAVWVDSNATNLLLEHSTFAGASSSGNGVIDTGVWNAPNASGVTAEAIYITNAAEDWHGSGTLNDSYLQAGATFSNNEGISHNEDVYLSDTTFSANHDTLLNSTGQTAVLFGDNDGGGDNGPGDNHWTVTNSLWAGGGYTFYPQAGATSVGSSSMDIENNRISNAYYPNIGYYGFMYPGETPVPPHVSSDQLCAGAGTKWTGNVLDSNNATISCTGNIGAPGSGDGGGTTTGGGGTTTPPPDTTPPTVSIASPSSGATESGTVTLSANASDNVGVSSVQFEIDGTPVGTPITASPYTYSWNTTGVANGTHTLSAIAKDAAGNTGTATSVSVTVRNTVSDTQPPTVPQGLSATATSSAQVSLKWDASTDNVGVTEYKVYRNGSSTALATITAPTTSTVSYTDATVSADTAYSYQVTALDAAGNQSAKSTSVSVTTPKAADHTPPSIPTGLHSTATTINSISLAWNASTDNTGGSGVAGYHLYRNGALIASPSGTTYTDTGLTPDTSYSYTVSAYDNAANGSQASAAVSVKTKATTTTPPDTTPPSVPTELHSTGTTASSVSLSWNASTDNTGGSGLAGYYLYRGSTKVASVAGTTFTNTDLAASTTYTYTVKAYDHAGNISAASNAVSAKTLVKATPIPKKHHHHWWQFWER